MPGQQTGAGTDRAGALISLCEGWSAQDKYITVGQIAHETDGLGEIEKLLPVLNKQVLMPPLPPDWG